MALNEKLNRYPGLKGGKAPKETKIPPLARIIIGGGLTTGVLGLSGCGPSSTEIRPTPTPEPEAQPTNLVFTLANEKQNDPDFQRLNQANTSFFQEFKKRNPQNPWQLGETVALGAGNVDYALTTVVGPNGEPISGVVSYLDKDGKLQSGFAIDFFTNIPSDDGVRAFGGIYPLKPEISQLLLEGKTVTIDPKKDTQGPIFGFVLNKGKNWIDFSTAMTQATTEEQRKEVFSIYVDEIYLQKPDGKTHLFSISKLSPSEQTQLVSYALPTATPANIELTPTPKPSPTPTITPTPQASPTPEPTPIPTIEVNGLQLPDPRITNPELFDLKKKEAPIPQFANALKNAGIELSPEQIAQGITYVSTKEDGTPLVDKNGNPFVVAVYNLDPSLFPEEYRDLAGPVPLMIAIKGENGWGWRRANPDNVFNLVNIPVGVYLEPGKNNDSINKVALQNFSQLSLPIYWHVMFPRNLQNPNFSLPDSIQKLANQGQKQVFGGSLVWQNTNFLPDWVKNSGITQEQITSIIGLIVRHYPNSSAWIVVNEPYASDFFASRLGYPNYVIESFRVARQYTSKPLILNDFDIELPGRKYQNTMNLVNTLRKENLIDGIGIQMHINPQNPPSKNILLDNFRSWGLPVYITELDCPTTNEQLKAEIFSNVVGAALESGTVTQINFWGLGPASWQENATLFDNNAQPTLSYYIILETVLNYLLR